jgi:hypothetical protein
MFLVYRFTHFVSNLHTKRCIDTYVSGKAKHLIFWNGGNRSYVVRFNETFMLFLPNYSAILLVLVCTRILVLLYFEQNFTLVYFWSTNLEKIHLKSTLQCILRVAPLVKVYLKSTTRYIFGVHLRVKVHILPQFAF